MTVLVIKLFEAKDKATLDTAIATYKAGAGAALLTAQRGSAMHAVWDESDQSSRIFAALAHEGVDIPASKTADLQHVYVEGDKLANAQTALNAALAQVEHLRVTDAVTTVAGKVTSATAPFVATDVGRIIDIAGVQKVITVYNAANDVSYNNAAGNFASGTGLTAKLLGAEVLQALHMNVYRESDMSWRFMFMAACEGQLP